MNREKKNRDEEIKVTENSKGKRLRLAREAMGLEASEAATKLYCETRFILALENDDHSIFAGSAYLYGYMRAYVKLLGLPLDEFVCDLKNIEEENERHFEQISYQPAVQKERGRRVLPLVVGLLLLAALIVAGLMLMSGDESARADSLNPLAENEVQVAQEMRSIPVPPARDTQADAADAEAAHHKASANQNVSADAARPRLLLEYKTDSWTDIRDATGKRLVYRMVEKGNRLELDSSPSYSILLGYSPGVNVSWDEKPFKQAEYQRENIAYFVVGEQKKTSSTVTARK